MPGKRSTANEFEIPPPQSLLADLAAALGVHSVTATQGDPSHTHLVRHEGRLFVLAAPYRKKSTRKDGEVWTIGEIEKDIYEVTYLRPRPSAELTRPA